MKNNRLAFTLLLFVLAIRHWHLLAGNEIPYQAVFGENWAKAKEYVSQNREWMQSICTLLNVDYQLATSVIFPELVRYSAVRDKIEITLLKSLYVYQGHEYSNFSVGVFQIKPSCAEKLLNEIKHHGDNRLKSYFRRKHSLMSVKEKRRAVIKDLENPRTEFLYVLGMIKVLESRYSKKEWKSPSEKIRFYAAAYNSGFYNSLEFIENQMGKNHFHLSLIKPVTCYNYSKIADAFYRELNIGH